jgi:hypothetical protein
MLRVVVTVWRKRRSEMSRWTKKHHPLHVTFPHEASSVRVAVTAQRLTCGPPLLRHTCFIPPVCDAAGSRIRWGQRLSGQWGG